jgi:hypothetical protein
VRAGLVGSLVGVGHRQRLRRIRSGIEAAQDAGRWTGRPPRGVAVEGGYLRVDVGIPTRADEPRPACEHRAGVRHPTDVGPGRQRHHRPGWSSPAHGLLADGREVRDRRTPILGGDARAAPVAAVQAR